MIGKVKKIKKRKKKQLFTVALILKNRNLTLKKRKEKKTKFVENDSDVIPISEPKHKQIICYNDSESDIDLVRH